MVALTPLNVISPVSATRVAPVTGRSYASISIASGASLSDILDLSGTSLIAIITPAAWTTAALTFRASLDGTNFYDVIDNDGTEFAVTALPASSKWMRFSLPDWLSPSFLQFRSGLSASPVTQGGTRTLIPVTG